MIKGPAAAPMSIEFDELSGNLIARGTPRFSGADLANLLNEASLIAARLRKDAVEMSDLRGFARELVGQMEKDLGTKLEWAAVDHWNTEHPHVHLIVRGVRDDGSDLVISRDYIKEGMRDRARDLITHELGPRTDQEIDDRIFSVRTLESRRDLPGANGKK